MLIMNFNVRRRPDSLLPSIRIPQLKCVTVCSSFGDSFREDAFYCVMDFRDLC